jgi:hypothetical protein
MVAGFGRMSPQPGFATNDGLAGERFKIGFGLIPVRNDNLSGMIIFTRTTQVFVCQPVIPQHVANIFGGLGGFISHYLIDTRVVIIMMRRVKNLNKL